MAVIFHFVVGYFEFAKSLLYQTHAVEKYELDIIIVLLLGDLSSLSVALGYVHIKLYQVCLMQHRVNQLSSMI